MNIITSLRIIGPAESIGKFIYDNIQVSDPTEEDYLLWNCKNFLIKNNLVDKDTSIPYTTAAILNIFNKYEETLGESNILNDTNTTTLLVSFESPNESVASAILAMSSIFTDLIIIGSLGDEHWDYNYGWMVIVFGKVIIEKPINFHDLIICKREIIEKSNNIVHNELSLNSLNYDEKKEITYIIENIFLDLKKNNHLPNACNFRIIGYTLHFDTLDRSALMWYDSCIFHNKIISGFLYYHHLNYYFGYSCKIGTKHLANDFLGLKNKRFKLSKSYDCNEEEYISRIEYLGNN